MHEQRIYIYILQMIIIHILFRRSKRKNVSHRDFNATNSFTKQR